MQMHVEIKLRFDADQTPGSAKASVLLLLVSCSGRPGQQVTASALTPQAGVSLLPLEVTWGPAMVVAAHRTPPPNHGSLYSVECRSRRPSEETLY